MTPNRLILTPSRIGYMTPKASIGKNSVSS